MANEVAFNVEFKEKIRATVIEATMNLFTPEQMDQLVNSEVKAFFESKTEHTGVLASPWRKLVWDNIYAYMQPKIQAVFNEERGNIRQEIDEWFLAQLVPDLKAGNKALFAQIAMVNGAGVQQKLMKQSADVVHLSVTNALRMMGQDYNIINQVPVLDFSQNPILVTEPKL